jgi:Cytochrome P460
MRRIVFVLVSVVALAGVIAYTAPVSGQAAGEAAPIYGIKFPAGYRDWRLISVAHEEGNLNDLRAQLGNDVAIKAYREGKLPFPDGTIIAALHWHYVSSRWMKSCGMCLSRMRVMPVAQQGPATAGYDPQRHGASSIANETVFEPRGLNRELRSLIHQYAGMTLLWSGVLGSFPEGLAPPAGTEAAAPAGPGAGERLGCES